MIVKLHQKARIWLIAVIAAIAGVSPALARDFSYEWQGQTLIYTVLSEEDKTCETKQGYHYFVAYPGNEVSGSLVIPATASDGENSYTVTSIGDIAFSRCSGLTSIEIPNSVTSIGDYVFSGCSSLTSVVYNSDVSGLYCFADAPVATISFGGTRVPRTYHNSMTQVTINNSVTSIDRQAFDGCSRITSIEIPNSVTSIGSSAFSGCSGLASIAMSNSVTSIGSHAFYGCSSLASFEIPNSVTSIGFDAFEGCKNLRTLIYNSDNDCEVFSKCPVTDLTYGGTIVPKLDLNNNNLRSITFGEHIKEISLKNVASDYKNLQKIAFLSDVPPVIKTEYSGTLFGETAPDNVVLSVPAESLSAYITREYYDDFRKWETNEGAESYSDGVLSYMVVPELSAAYVMYSPDYSMSTVDIPRRISIDSKFYTVKGILPRTFENVTGIKTVTFANSSVLEQICSKAFAGVKDISEIKLPSTVSFIGSSAFSGCTGLTSIEIPNSVTEINDSTFYGCSGLTSVKIPNSVTGIGSSAFSGCSSLTSIEIPNSVTSIGSSAFYKCSRLTSIEIPNSVTTIGSSAFEECTSLTKFKFPSFITEISEWVLAGCTALTEVTFPKNYTSIGSRAFNNCTALDQEITIPASVLKIEEFAFSGCSKIKSVTIEDGASAIELGNEIYRPFDSLDYLYLGRNFNNTVVPSVAHLVVGNQVTEIPCKICNKGIETLELGAYLQSIGNDAFNNVLTSKCTEIVIPPLVTEIGASAFAGNPGLKTVKMGYSVETIGEKAFDANTGLEGVYITSKTPPTAADNSVFANYRMPLYVVPGTTSLYEDATPCWYRFFDEGSISEQTPVSMVKASIPSLAGARPGDSFKITATVEPADATLPQLFYMSTNPDRVCVDNDGVVTILESKTTEEGVETYSDGDNDECEIRVYSMYADVAPAIVKVDISSAGIEDVITDSPADGFDPSLPYEVYNLNGMMVGTDSTNLNPGIYIIRQSGKAHKIAVK